MRFMRPITYLHLSLIRDAPRVASLLVKYGTDVWEVGGEYPDMTPLSLALADPRGTRNLDAALRIACSYALPRTCRYLLSRGANPNSLSKFGLAAIHLAVRKRLPPRSLFLPLDDQDDSEPFDVGIEDESWPSSLVQTVSTLLEFGADATLRSGTSRVHRCGHKCWRSPDCEHRGQTVLHLACGGGNEEVVSLLLAHGADPMTADGDGYLPLFSALCQDNKDVALRLLRGRRDADPVNPIVVRPHESTALHIACRFASTKVVLFLRRRGVDPNATDAFGRTPLHELLGQTCFGLEERVLEILPHLDLDTHGASTVARRSRAQGVMTARQMATAHPFSSVRTFFDTAPGSRSGSFSLGRVQQTPKLDSSGGPSAGSWEMFEPVAARHPNTESRQTFPPLRRSPGDKEGIEQVTTRVDCPVRLNKTTTTTAREMNRPSPSPSSVKHQRRDHNDGGKKAATGVLIDFGDDENKAPAVMSATEIRTSESARFWGSLVVSSSRQNLHSRPKAELAPYTGKRGRELPPDGASRGNRKQRNKWAVLDIS
jgi:ankyrin repeat protein